MYQRSPSPVLFTKPDLPIFLCMSFAAIMLVPVGLGPR